MSTLERALRELLRLPVITRIGLVIMVIGRLADVAAHLEATGHSGHLHDHTASELSTHLIGFLGMAAVLHGIVLDGLRRQCFGPPAGPSPNGGK